MDARRSHPSAAAVPAPLVPLAVPDEVPEGEVVGYYRATWRRFRRDRVSMAALALFLLICLLALAAPLIAEGVLGTDPARQRLQDRFAAPGARYLLGADEYGRDQLTRLLFGARVSISLGFIVAAISVSLGTAIGLLAGYFGGWVDDLVNALIQIKRGVPFLYLLILIAMVFPPTLLSLSLLFGLWGWSGVSRVVRAQTMAGRGRDYVEAARALGASDWRIMYRHILPNTGSIVLTVAGFDVAGTILAEASISFLGFGIQPPTASWGNMLTNSLEYVSRAWWLVAGPGVAIGLTVLSVFLLADGLRDALDPRLVRDAPSARAPRGARPR
jgi:peptide/nickel transport system permease protein